MYQQIHKLLTDFTGKLHFVSLCNNVSLRRFHTLLVPVYLDILNSLDLLKNKMKLIKFNS